MSSKPEKGCSNSPIATLITLLAGVIAIGTCITGYSSLPKFVSDIRGIVQPITSSPVTPPPIVTMLTINNINTSTKWLPRVFTKEGATEKLAATAPEGTLIIAGGNAVDGTANAILTLSGNQTVTLTITNGYIWVYPIDEAEQAFCDEVENTLVHGWRLDNLRPYPGWSCGGRLVGWMQTVGHNSR